MCIFILSSPNMVGIVKNDTVFFFFFNNNSGIPKTVYNGLGELHG
jgi:hypothetical protein